MVELFDADLKRKGFDGVALPAGSYELHKINGVRLDINKSLDELSPHWVWPWPSWYRRRGLGRSSG